MPGAQPGAGVRPPGHPRQRHLPGPGAHTTTIDGAKITTGSISAAHIDAAGLTANEVTLLPYEVGAGSNTGSSRMEITSDVIKIYNGGTLRVKLGNLA